MQYNFQRNTSDDEMEPYTEITDRDYTASQENAFIKYITQIDAIPNVIDNEFLRKYNRRVLFSGKFKGLAFINNPKTIKLNSCMRLNMSLEEDAGLLELADETVFDNIDVMQVTRGTRGNLQYALITQKREFRDTSEKEKRKGFFSGLLKRKEPENVEGEQMQETY